MIIPLLVHPDDLQVRISFWIKQFINEDFPEFVAPITGI
jgi:hypothetical protein